jgi:hypothetical protein
LKFASQLKDEREHGIVTVGITGVIRQFGCAGRELLACCSKGLVVAYSLVK